MISILSLPHVKLLLRPLIEIFVTASRKVNFSRHQTDGFRKRLLLADHFLLDCFTWSESKGTHSPRSFMARCRIINLRLAHLFDQRTFIATITLYSAIRGSSFMSSFRQVRIIIFTGLSWLRHDLWLQYIFGRPSLVFNVHSKSNLCMSWLRPLALSFFLLA